MADATESNDAPRPDRETRWGTSSFINDEDEARALLLAAAARCVIRRGDARIRIDEVAREARVARSTVYRYFRTRDELVSALLITWAQTRTEEVVGTLRRSRDAASGMIDVIMGSVEHAHTDKFMAALWSPESLHFIDDRLWANKELRNIIINRLKPFIARWKSTGEIHRTLNVEQTAQWLMTVATMMLAKPWSEMDSKKMRRFLEQHVVAALIATPNSP